MSFSESILLVASSFELIGVGILAAGAVWAGWHAVSSLRRMQADPAQRRAIFPQLRTDLGRAILLGLEVLVAADIIRTVAVRPTLNGVVVLGLIVLIRTFLSFSLEVEIEGTLPWKKSSPRSSTRAD